MAGFRFSPRPNRAHEIRWREWGDAAFEEARARNVPVLLGISAVWCHWCHVMDETTYSSEDIIKEINERFVPIRVDNDERPDVNRRYNMGGWPTTVFLTPEGEILHGGTYLSPEVMYRTVLGVSDLWSERREDLLQRVAEVRRKEAEARAAPPGDLRPEIVDRIRSLVSGQYDPQFGGFGREQKFPQPKVLRFLLDEHRRGAAPELGTMVTTTLDAMARGGLFDHVEGGFFRYATMRDWSVPHYEKMLEDNAELLGLYADAHRLFPDRGYDAVARDVIRWMDAVLYQPDRRLWSGSQDADEHYYTLDAAERARHGAPYVDRRLYTAWNALAAIAYAKAGRALGERGLRSRASEALRAIDERLRDPAGALHRSDDGTGPRLPDLLEDAVAVLALALELGDLPGALRTARRMRDRLADAERGGFFDTPERVERGRLARRERPLEDNALAADALLRLAALSGDEGWREAAHATLRSFVGEYRSWGQFAASYANAVARALREPVSVVVVGAGPGAAGLVAAAEAALDPDLVVRALEPGRDAATIAEGGFPADRVAAYLCVGTSCGPPLPDEGSLTRELAAARASMERA